MLQGLPLNTIVCLGQVPIKTTFFLILHYEGADVCEI